MRIKDKKIITEALAGTAPAGKGAPEKIKNRIKIVIIDNPFKTSGRHTKTIDMPETQKKIRLDFITQNMDAGYIVILNGAIIPKKDFKHTFIKSNDSVIITRRIGGEAGQEVASLLTMVGALTASVLMPGFGNIVAGAILFVGGAIISMFDPPKTEDATRAENYSWDAPRPNLSAGAPIGVTYGTVQINAPQVLAASVTSDGANQFLNYLLSGGEGELDNIDNIKLDNNPITNFSDYIIETRLGTNDQDPVHITTLGEAQSAQALPYVLTTSYSTDITDNNQAHSLQYTFRAPGGLYAIKNADRGASDLQNWPAPGTKLQLRNRLSLEYKLTTDTIWTTHAETVTGNDETPIFKTFKYNGLTAGQYDIRAKIIATEVYASYIQYDINGTVVARPANWYNIGSALLVKYIGSNYLKTTNWETITTFFDILPIRPCLSLVAIKIKATAQISGGAPAVTWTQSRPTVQVYDPDDDTWTEKPANNPWWAAYDLIVNCRKIKNIKTGLYENIVYGAPPETIIYSEFKTCADYIQDTLGIYFNYYFNEPTTLAEALKIATTAGRGAIVIKGSQYGAVCDMPGDPVQVFNMANIKNGSFKETFLPIIDRANCIEINYTDRDKNWERTTVPVYRTDWDDGGIIQNPTRLDMPYTIDATQAWREGKYWLRRNEFIRRNIEFKADIDAIRCDIGDIILLQHDLPAWAAGGRIIADLGDNQIQTDKKLNFEPGTTYKILIRHSETDLLETYGATPAGSETETDIIQLDATPALAIIPGDDLYTLGIEDIEGKPFKITNITRTGDLERNITCQEYDARVYDETGTAPEIDYTTFRAIAEVIGLSGLIQTLTQRDGSVIYTLSAAWALEVSQGEQLLNFLYSYSIDGGDTFTTPTTTPLLSFTMTVPAATNFMIKVQTKNIFNQISTGVTTDLLYPQDITPPADPATIEAFPVSMHLGGGYNTEDGWHLAALPGGNNPPWFNDPNFAGFIFKYIIGPTANWDKGININNTPILNNNPGDSGWGYTILNTLILPIDFTITIMTKAVNTAGIYSANAATITVDTAPQNTELGRLEIEPAFTFGTCYGLATVDANELKANEILENPGFYNGFYYDITYPCTFSGYINLTYDIDGVFAVFYTRTPGTWTPYDGPLAVTLDEIIYIRITLEVTSLSQTRRGIIKTFDIIQWSPPRIDDTGWHNIVDTGETIAPTTPFNYLQDIQTQIENDGIHTATQLQITDKNNITGAHFHGYDPAGAARELRVKVIYAGY